MISSVVSAQVNVNTTEAFYHVTTIDLKSIFKGHGFLPAVVNVKSQTGKWDEAGQTQTVYLSDGSYAQEQLTQYNQSNYFSYIVSNFSGALGLLIASATGEWWFDKCDSLPNITLIRWSYTFIPKSSFAIPILWLINKFLWSGYMRSVMANIKAQLDTKTLT